MRRSEKKEKAIMIIPNEIIERRIYLLQGKKVMFAPDLAVLYGVTTKGLVQAVRRNKERFPRDFMYPVTNKELAILRSQFVTSRLQVTGLKYLTMNQEGQTWGGTRYRHYVFTEQGVAMLSSVLRSRQAIQVNIQIMRTFTKLRELIQSNDLLRRKIEELERKYAEHDSRFIEVFEVIKKLVEPAKEVPKRRIGFHAKHGKPVAVGA